MEPSVIDLISGDLCTWEEEPLLKLSKDGQLNAFKHYGFWQPMDTLRDKSNLESLWSTNIAEIIMGINLMNTYNNFLIGEIRKFYYRP